MSSTAEMKQVIKNVAEKISQYVVDAAELKVETRYIELGASAPSDARLAASSVIRLDGDNDTIVPMKRSPDGILVVDSLVYEMHRQNVQSAIEYRARMLEQMLALLRSV